MWVFFFLDWKERDMTFSAQSPSTLIAEDLLLSGTTPHSLIEPETAERFPGPSPKKFKLILRPSATLSEREELPDGLPWGRSQSSTSVFQWVVQSLLPKSPLSSIVKAVRLTFCVSHGTPSCVVPWYGNIRLIRGHLFFRLPFMTLVMSGARRAAKAERLRKHQQNGS